MSINFVKLNYIDIEYALFTLHFESTSIIKGQEAIGRFIEAWWDYGNAGGFGGTLPGLRTPTFNLNVAEWRVELDHLMHSSDYSLEKDGFLLQTLLRGLDNLELTFPYIYPGESLSVNTLVIGERFEDLSKNE